tara:strand:- start:574 stop:795 length:222 start_codon:yes stop_codon:yes gene_type:complete
MKSSFSVGKINYFLKAFFDIELLKYITLVIHPKKINYTYVLTPKDIQQKAIIMKQFILNKMKEYDKLNSYITI